MMTSPTQDSINMEDDGQTHAQRAANLARIRDNQRRSRARRKEYLSELETKYRVCEQTGVEASAEIQAAARKVVDENKKLRRLLAQTGMSDVDIDAMLGEETGLEDAPHSASASASTLENLLGVKRQCGPGGSCSPSQASDGTGRMQDCRPLLAVERAVQLQAPTHSPIHHVSSAVESPSQQYYNPQNLSTSSMPIPVTGFAHHPYAMPGPIMAPQHQQQEQQNFGYGMPQDDMYASWLPTSQYQIPTINNSTSCYVAADVLRGIKPDAASSSKSSWAVTVAESVMLQTLTSSI